MLRGDDANVYGHWLDHSVFAMVDDSVAVSFGGSPGTNPARIGGGIWKGALVGKDTQTGERIEGDAVIDIDDFARPDVDIALTGIEDARGRARGRSPLGELASGSRRISGAEHGRFDRRPVLWKRSPGSGWHLRTRSTDRGFWRLALTKIGGAGRYP